MGRLLTTFRFLAGLLAPGGVLVLATWAVQREDVVQSAAAPYAAYFCFSALVAAVLLSWYHDQSRLLCSAAAVVLTRGEEYTLRVRERSQPRRGRT